jgi:hypothetical protein
MPLSCTSNRDLTAIVEIARLLKPVSQARILPGHCRGHYLNRANINPRNIRATRRGYRSPVKLFPVSARDL